MHAVWLLLPNCTLQHDGAAASPLHSQLCCVKWDLCAQCTPVYNALHFHLKKNTHTHRLFDKETNCAYKHYGAIQSLTDRNAHLAKTTGFPLSGFWSKTNMVPLEGDAKSSESDPLLLLGPFIIFFIFFFVALSPL